MQLDGALAIQFPPGSPEMVASVMLVSSYEVDKVGLEVSFSECEASIAFHAESYCSAWSGITSQSFDAVLVDTSLPDKDPIVLIKDIVSAIPKQVVMLLSKQENPRMSFLAHTYGARGVLLKTDSSTVLHKKLMHALSGTNTWTKKELRQLRVGASAIPEDGDHDKPLTVREEEVLRLIAMARSNLEIAAQLKVRYETVKEHVQHILRKVGVNDRTQAAVWALRRARR